MDIHAAALTGDVESVRQYLVGSGDPNILNEAGITPLHSAAVQGQSGVIRELVAAGADTDLKVSRGEREGASNDASPLLLAVVGGHLEAARALLEGGAEVGAKNSKGLTPLHVSCLKPNAGMVSLLLLWGADTNARDKKKRTPDQIIGRRGKDPREEEAVRAVLKQATAAKLLALAKSANIHSKVNVPHKAEVEDVIPSVTPAADAGAVARAPASRAASLSGNAGVAGATGGPNMGCVDSAAGAALSSFRRPPPPPPPPSVVQSFSQTSGSGTSPMAPSPSLLPPPPPPPPPEEPGLSHADSSLHHVAGTEGTNLARLTTSGPPELLLENPSLPPSLPWKPTDPASSSSSPPAAAADAGASTTTTTSEPSRVTEPQAGSVEHSFEIGRAAPQATPQAIAGVLVTREGAIGEGQEASAEAATVAEDFGCGVVLKREYELEKVLPCSSGSSEIWLASKVFTGEEVVVKRVSSGKEAAFERERAVLKFLQRQGIKGGCQYSIPFVGVIPELRCLVLGRGNKNLRQIGQKFYQRYAGNAAGYMDRVRPCARQVVEICQWLHRLGIVWGDAKPENFVEGQDGDLKAIDFDSACSVSAGMASTEKDIEKRVGSRFDAEHVLTPRYCAPERAKASLAGESCLATKATDVWSIGMVLFWLLTGQDYFEKGLADAEVLKSLASQGFTVSLAGVDSKQEQAKNLLSTMLSHDPRGRGSMDSVLGRAFFAGGASVTAAKMQLKDYVMTAHKMLKLAETFWKRVLADMAASLEHVSVRLEATIREEGGSTRSLLDESMKRLESRADEILNKLGRIDRMLDHVVKGSADCPRLFVLTPATDSQALWKPDTWFSDSNVLTFLCAHDLAPIGKGIKVPCPRRNLEKWAPAIQASAFVVKLGCKAACMTAGVSPTAVDGMSAALGMNVLAGQKVSAALRSAAGKALGDVDERGSDSLRRCGGAREQSSEEQDEEQGRELTGEAYEALVSFLDENESSWRASLNLDMTKAVRGDGKVSWTCHEHAGAWSRSGGLSMPTEYRGHIPVVDESSPCTTDLSAAAASTAAAVPDSSHVVAVQCGEGPTMLSPSRGNDKEEEPTRSSKNKSGIAEEKSNRSDDRGKQRIGLGVLAKIKGRFGRHAG